MFVAFRAAGNLLFMLPRKTLSRWRIKVWGVCRGRRDMINTLGGK